MFPFTYLLLNESLGPLERLTRDDTFLAKSHKMDFLKRTVRKTSLPYLFSQPKVS